MKPILTVHNTALLLTALCLASAPAAEKKSSPAGGEKAAPVQMLVPDFAVRALAVEVPAINAVRYRADGKLMALGYDGKVWLLTDTDADGLEDKADVFYDAGREILSLGMALTPPGYAHGQGVFIARKGGLVLEVDTDGDDRADKEIVVADNWELSRRVPGGVSDAIGVALDAEGNVFFGLGAGNSQNGYLLENGEAHYRITSERGTIMRIRPDFSKREIIATGIRANIGLAFNAAGDLFCTDQEGATWMPNGNPFDELLHIQTGRHYGFPPRHPKYLPQVIDEPSVFDYGPQHESTCGLQFNEPVNGGPVFGPAWWRGDAFICGESRGKIHRTKLVKTTAGYVAQDQIIARSSWLTIDQCVSPRGDLVLTTHSGPPDWGNGPTAIGRLFKITRAATDAPLPVLAHVASPSEVRVVFDRPLSTTAAADLEKRVKLTEGWFVKEGDPFESFRPGYRVVGLQQSSPRVAVPVKAVRLSADLRTVIITTAERREALNCAIEFAEWPQAAKPLPGELPQKSVVAVAADFSGVSAEWIAKDGAEKWSGWLPHFDLEVARVLTAASAEDARLWELLKKRGTLTLRGQLDLWSLLRPAVQPGERLDYTPPAERVSITFSGAMGTRVTTPGAIPLPASETCDGGVCLKNIPAKQRSWLPVEITVPTGGETTLHVAWHTAEDARPRAFALRRVLVPWAVPAAEPIQIVQPPELAGGDRAKGEQIFTAVCVVCHSVNGKGGLAGPDLSNLLFRDYASVLKDIADPNATINPDHVAFNLTLKNGDSLTGVVVEDKGGHLLLAGLNGPPVSVKKADIGEMKASAVSLMPTDLDKALGEQGMKDLLNYLMLPPAGSASKVESPNVKPSDPKQK